MKRRKLAFLFIFLLSLTLLSIVGCSSDSTSSDNKKEIPNISVSYIFTNHQTPLMIAAEKADEFKESGVYLKEVVSRQKYVLMSGEEEIANIELVACKSGSETTTMMSQGHVDIGLASSAAIISGIDQGMEIKMLCPVHTEGIGLVGAKESPANNWDEFYMLAKEMDEPIKVGFHSPTSAPLILFEAALKEAGLNYTFNPEDLDADVLLVDLKETSNLLPSLISKQVDAWVGPSPYPELAVVEDAGKVILDMKHLPPEGKWYDFPCCVVAATNEIIAEKPEVVEVFLKVIGVAAEYANTNKDEAAKITAEWTGISEDAAQKSTVKYTVEPSEPWINNLGLIFNALKDSSKLKGDFTEKDYTEIQEDIFELDLVKKTLN